MPFCSLHRFQGNFRRCRRERAENATGMKPACAVLSKNLIPINFGGLQLRNCRVPAIVTAERCADAEASLCKIEAVARRVAYAVMFDPANQRLVYASLIDKVLQQPPHGIIGERRDDRGVQAEAALQSAGDIVFAAALAHIEGSRRGNAAVTWVEAQHDFAKTDDVPAAILLRLDRHGHVLTSTARFIRKQCQSIVMVLVTNFQIHVCISWRILAGSSLGTRA